MSMKTKTLIFALTFLTPFIVLANDSVGYISAGGIIFKKSKEISMEKETLLISKKLISIDYIFKNNSSTDITETVLFPIPAVGEDLESPVGPRHNIDFSVSIDGLDVKPKRAVRAISHKMDVTAELKAAGLSDSEIEEFSFPEQLGYLLKNKNLAFAQDGKIFAGWQIAVTYFWEQKFPAGSEIEVHQEYAPIVGFGAHPMNFLGEFPWTPSGYCVDAGFMAGARKLQQKHETKNPPPANDFSFMRGVDVSELGYILTTGANWSGPIKDFTLILKKETPDQLVSTCFDGKFTKEDDLTLVSNIKNFVPSRELKLLFVSTTPTYLP